MLVGLGLLAGIVFGVQAIKPPATCGGDRGAPSPPSANALWFLGQPTALHHGDVTFQVDRVERGQIVRPMVVHWYGPITAWNRYEVRTEPSSTGFFSGSECGYPSRRAGLVMPANLRVMSAATPTYDVGLLAAVLAMVLGALTLIGSTRRATRRHREIVRTHALP